MTRPARILLLCCALAAPTAAFATVDVTIIGGLSREATLLPGESSEGKILVHNNTDAPKPVKVYQTDYRHYCDGSNHYEDPGTVKRSNAAWVTVRPQQLTIPPDEEGTIYYTVQVPNDASLVGTYWSLLMVEPLADDSPEVISSDDGQPRVAIRTIMRYGIQMVTHIGRTGEYSMQFAGKQLVADDSLRVLEVDIENTGHRWLSPAVWAELYDADGASLGRFEGQRLHIFPECSARFRINLTEVPPATYNALIVADNGDDHVFGTQAKLQLE